MHKALSPIISSVILILIALSIAYIAAPWMYELVITTTNETESTVNRDIICRNAGLDFDSNYGYYGVSWNFSGNVSANQTDWIKAKVVNTGTVDLSGLSFEVTLETDSDEEIKEYEPTYSSAVSGEYPLRPSRSSIITANITEDINHSITTLKSVKVFNGVCPDMSPYLDL